MATRNQTASWIHYPFAQPAAGPLEQRDKEQITWNFRLTMVAAVRSASRLLLRLGIGR